jgi:hypothetical protein
VIFDQELCNVLSVAQTIGISNTTLNLLLLLPNTKFVARFETNVPNELDKKIHRQNAIMIEYPELGIQLIHLMFLTYGLMLMTCVKEKFSVE